MSIYGNEYELYYRNLKNRGLRDKSKEENTSSKIVKKKKKYLFGILVYDLSFSLLFLIAMFILKNANYEGTKHLYHNISVEFTKENETLNNYNNMIINKVEEVYYSIYEVSNDGVQNNE